MKLSVQYSASLPNLSLINDSGQRSPSKELRRLVLGSEGHGLSRRWEQAADRRAVIPMQAGVDSLNVAAATAVACYVTSRR